MHRIIAMGYGLWPMSISWLIKHCSAGQWYYFIEIATWSQSAWVRVKYSQTRDHSNITHAFTTLLQISTFHIVHCNDRPILNCTSSLLVKIMSISNELVILRLPCSYKLNFFSSVKKPAPAPAAVSNIKKSGSNQNSAELKRLQGEVADLNAAIEGLEKERDFYFSKLRDIEVGNS